MTWFEPDSRFPQLQPGLAVWEGEITAMVGTRPKVKIPLLVDDSHEFGPCRVLEGTWTTGLLPTVTGAASGGTAHTHPITEPAVLAKGQQVLVVFLGGRLDRPAVIGRLFA